MSRQVADNNTPHPLRFLVGAFISSRDQPRITLLTLADQCDTAVVVVPGQTGVSYHVTPVLLTDGVNGFAIQSFNSCVTGRAVRSHYLAVSDAQVIERLQGLMAVGF